MGILLTYAAEKHGEVHDSDRPPSTLVVFILRVTAVHMQDDKQKTSQHILNGEWVSDTRAAVAIELLHLPARIVTEQWGGFVWVNELRHFFYFLRV